MKIKEIAKNGIEEDIMELVCMKQIADSLEGEKKIKLLEDMLKKTVFSKATMKLHFFAKFFPERIMKSGPATIVFWADGTKTVVKCAEGTTPDDYAAFCAALGKKVYGSNSALKRVMMMAMENDMEDKPGGSK